MSCSICVCQLNYFGCGGCSIILSRIIVHADNQNLVLACLEVSCINVASRTYQTFSMSKNGLDKHLPCFYLLQYCYLGCRIDVRRLFILASRPYRPVSRITTPLAFHHNPELSIPFRVQERGELMMVHCIPAWLSKLHHHPHLSFSLLLFQMPFDKCHCWTPATASK